MWVTSPRSNFVRVLEHKLVCTLDNLPELPVTYIIRLYLSYPRWKLLVENFASVCHKISIYIWYSLADLNFNFITLRTYVSLHFDPPIISSWSLYLSKEVFVWEERATRRRDAKRKERKLKNYIKYSAPKTESISSRSIVVSVEGSCSRTWLRTLRRLSIRYSIPWYWISLLNSLQSSYDCNCSCSI